MLLLDQYKIDLEKKAFRWTKTYQFRENENSKPTNSEHELSEYLCEPQMEMDCGRNGFEYESEYMLT